MNPIDRNDLHVFATVARLASFSAAATDLGVRPSAVSRRVAKLEAATGFRLLHRTTRSVSLTEAGRLFYERIAHIDADVQGALDALLASRVTPHGSLRITAPPDHHGIIWSLVCGFLQSHPEVDLQIHHTLERVDLVREGFDVAIRGGPAPDSTEFSATQIFDSRILLAASESYLRVHGTPSSVEELERHDGICMDPWAPNAIRRLDGDRGPVRLHMRNRLRANSLYTAQRAALAGLGIAPLLELTCKAHLDSGELIEVLRGAMPDHAPMWVLAPLAKARSATTDAFVAHVIAAAAAITDAPSSAPSE